jgi:hypothetical protein
MSIPEEGREGKMDIGDFEKELNEIGRMLQDSVTQDTALKYRLVLDWTGPQSLAQTSSVMFAQLVNMLQYGVPSQGKRARLRLWEEKQMVIDTNRPDGDPLFGDPE